MGSSRSILSCMPVLVLTCVNAIVVSATPAAVSPGERRQISVLVRELHFASRGRGHLSADLVQGRLIAIAQQDPADRAEVIGILLKALQRHGVINHIGDDAFWLNACMVLGKLKATEAIDLLVSELGVGNGIASNTFGTRPAAYGLALIGDSAVPRIAEALVKPAGCASRPCRVDAIYALGYISSPAAKEVLRNLAKTDTDLRPIIEAELRAH